VIWWDTTTTTRLYKNFTDAIEAELFHQEKVLGQPIDTNRWVLKEIATYKKYFAPDKLAALQVEIAKLRQQLAAKHSAEEAQKNERMPGERSGQSINFRALLWAYDQEDLSVTAKAVLVTFAMHANQHGYTWPGVDRIASIWGMDRETVRRQIEDLLLSRKIFRTKKRCGATRQVKVYRMPKNTYESGGKSYPFVNDESEAKAGDKRRTSGGESAPNKEQVNKEPVAVAITDLQRAQLYSIAATTTDSSELIEKLKPRFPSHDVNSEMRGFRKYRNDHGRPATARAFIDWMMRAEPPLSPPKRTGKPAATTTSEHEEEIDPEQQARFLKEFEDRKSRKTTS